MRIQKWISSTGILSRRKAEEALLDGRIRVNGKVIHELGTAIDPEHDVVELDGVRITNASTRTVLAFHKPVEVITSLSDPEHRSIVADFLPEKWKRLRPVGRLDYFSEGLLILTDDGVLANEIAHPSRGVDKEYRVWLDQAMDHTEVKRLVTGVELEDGVGRFVSVNKVLGQNFINAYDVVVEEGRNRFVRRMLDHVGRTVRRLMRTRIGEIYLGSLPPGKYRELKAQDLAFLGKRADRKA